MPNRGDFPQANEAAAMELKAKLDRARVRAALEGWRERNPMKCFCEHCMRPRAPRFLLYSEGR